LLIRLTQIQKVVIGYPLLQIIHQLVIKLAYLAKMSYHKNSIKELKIILTIILFENFYISDQRNLKINN